MSTLLESSCASSSAIAEEEFPSMFSKAQIDKKYQIISELDSLQVDLENAENPELKTPLPLNPKSTGTGKGKSTSKSKSKVKGKRLQKRSYVKKRWALKDEECNTPFDSPCSSPIVEEACSSASEAYVLEASPLPDQEVKAPKVLKIPKAKAKTKAKAKSKGTFKEKKPTTATSSSSAPTFLNKNKPVKEKVHPSKVTTTVLEGANSLTKVKKTKGMGGGIVKRRHSTTEVEKIFKDVAKTGDGGSGIYKTSSDSTTGGDSGSGSGIFKNNSNVGCDNFNFHGFADSIDVNILPSKAGAISTTKFSKQRRCSIGNSLSNKATSKAGGVKKTQKKSKTTSLTSSPGFTPLSGLSNPSSPSSSSPSSSRRSSEPVISLNNIQGILAEYPLSPNDAARQEFLIGAFQNQSDFKSKQKEIKTESTSKSLVLEKPFNPFLDLALASPPSAPALVSSRCASAPAINSNNTEFFSPNTTVTTTTTNNSNNDNSSYGNENSNFKNYDYNYYNNYSNDSNFDNNNDNYNNDNTSSHNNPNSNNNNNNNNNNNINYIGNNTNGSKDNIDTIANSFDSFNYRSLMDMTNNSNGFNVNSNLLNTFITAPLSMPVNASSLANSMLSENMPNSNNFYYPSVVDYNNSNTNGFDTGFGF
eukprot:Awhi_evm1s14478